MKEEPLVTIVTITFNLIKACREDSFRRCLESVHNQTYKNIEHIVVDGASKDKTVDLLDEYATREWIKYISETDSGIYDAMNKGIKMAKGKYIAFLNSDDYFHGKNGIENSVIALEESGAAFSYAPVRIIDEQGIINKNHPHAFPKISDIFHQMPFCHQTMFTRRDVLINEGLFDAQNFKSAGDYDLIIRLCLKRYKSVYVADMFTTYTWGGFSITNSALSIKEVTDLYYKNYSKICSITREECRKMYAKHYVNLPRKLADKLKDNKEYFDFKEFLSVNRPGGKFFRKFRNFSNKLGPRIRLGIFSPRKFIQKVVNKIKGQVGVWIR